MAKKATKRNPTRKTASKKGVRTSNSPTAVLSRKVRALQKEKRRLENECDTLAGENYCLTERIQILEDDKAKLEVHLRETVPGNNPNIIDDPRLAHLREDEEDEYDQPANDSTDDFLDGDGYEEPTGGPLNGDD